VSDAPEDYDLLAAEYVLGVLDATESAAVEALAASDESVVVSIEQWQNRLAPLALVVSPVAPPEALWPRIAASIGGFAEPAAAPAPAAAPGTAPGTAPETAEVISFPRRAWNSPGVWRAATVAALALAAAFAGIAFLQRPAPPAQFAAALAPASAPAPVFLAETQPDGSILVRPLTRVAVDSGKDLELWALPQGATRPVSLGVLPAIGKHVPGDLARANTQLLVSLEPQGGSPTGQPTGPVLYAGTLTKVD
jgi:anti-sigma-K factor RskA